MKVLSLLLRFQNSQEKVSNTKLSSAKIRSLVWSIRESLKRKWSMISMINNCQILLETRKRNQTTHNKQFQTTLVITNQKLNQLKCNHKEKLILSIYYSIMMIKCLIQSMNLFAISKIPIYKITKRFLYVLSHLIFAHKIPQIPSRNVQISIFTKQERLLKNGIKLE